MNTAPLPIETYLPQINGELRRSRRLILSAAPGAGKTTCVPQELLKLTSKKILLVEPRRVAAGAAAARIAALCGESVGGIAGYRVRGASAVSHSTRIIAVTPGVLLRMLQDDPMLEAVGAVIFDEFHERKWECDLALSFIDDLENSAGKRLYLTIMSATADTDRLAAFMEDAAHIDVPGKLHPVEIRWGEDGNERSIVIDSARATLRICRETPGDVLVFLPGAGEISAVRELLLDALVTNEVTVLPLHGNLPLSEQMRALAPDPHGRKKIVLATNVAESSLTIDGITAVVDSGWERRMVYDPAAGMPFLKLEKITRASADQRAGRAGRTAPGVALRLWSKFDHAARAGHPVPEILRSELSPLLLEVLTWGSSVKRLRWLDAPPEAAIAEAGRLLVGLGAVKAGGGITQLGRRLSGMPVHPRIGSMLLRAEKLGALDDAIDLAAKLESRIPVSRTADISAIPPSRDAAVLRAQLRRCLGGRNDTASGGVPTGVLLAGAFPDWIARRRGTSGGIYRLSGGGAARLGRGDDLERCEFLAAARVEGGDTEGFIRLASPLEKADLEKYFSDMIATDNRIVFNPETGRASARIVRRLGEIILSEGAAAAAPPEEISRAVISAALERGMEMPPDSNAAGKRLLDRIRFAHRLDPEHYPDWSLRNWRERWSATAAEFPLRSFADLENLPWPEIIRTALGREKLHRLDREFPPVFKPPRGPEIRLDYSRNVPTLAVKIQALYTLDTHPCVGSKRLPLKLELLSPAGRPVQVTSDLPGFWRGSWKLVRKEMKSRYPKHLWPEDPLHPEK